MPTFNFYRRDNGGLITTITADSFKRAVEAGVRSGVNFTQADMSNQDLSNGKFSGGNFTAVKFDGGDHTNANFETATMTGATLNKMRSPSSIGLRPNYRYTGVTCTYTDGKSTTEWTEGGH